MPCALISLTAHLFKCDQTMQPYLLLCSLLPIFRIQFLPKFCNKFCVDANKSLNELCVSISVYLHAVDYCLVCFIFFFTLSSLLNDILFIKFNKNAFQH